jgi:hypothetical protein
MRAGKPAKTSKTFGATELGELAVDGRRPVSGGDGDVPAIGAGDEIERSKRRRDRLDAG